MTSAYLKEKWVKRFFVSYWKGKTRKEKAKFLADYIFENHYSKRHEFTTFEYEYLYRDYMIPHILNEFRKRKNDFYSKWILMENNCWYLESSLAFYKCWKCKKLVHRDLFNTVSNQFKVNLSGECSVMCNDCKKRSAIKNRLKVSGWPVEEISDGLVEAKLNILNINTAYANYKNETNGKTDKDIRGRKQLSRTQ